MDTLLSLELLRTVMHNSYYCIKHWVIVSCKIIFEFSFTNFCNSVTQCLLRRTKSIYKLRVLLTRHSDVHIFRWGINLTPDKLHTTIESRNVFSVSSVSNGIAGDDCFMLYTTNFKAVQKSNFKFNNITRVQKPQSSKSNWKFKRHSRRWLYHAIKQKVHSSSISHRTSTSNFSSIRLVPTSQISKVTEISNSTVNDVCFIQSTINFRAVQKSNFKFNNITGVPKPQSSKRNWKFKRHSRRWLYHAIKQKVHSSSISHRTSTSNFSSTRLVPTYQISKINWYFKRLSGRQSSYPVYH